VSNASSRELITKLGRSGIEVHAWHIEGWVELPTFTVVLEDHARGDARFFTGGTACHLDPAAAFEKALLEALYARFAVITGSREDLGEQSAPYAARTYEQARREVLACCPTGPGRRLSELPDRSTPSIAGDIAEVLRALGRAGLERVLACDLSSAQATLKTVRVVVPGLECCLKKARIGPRLVQWVNTWGPAVVAA
jgi:YcaO-like protein with predicted kinase domain